MKNIPATETTLDVGPFDEESRGKEESILKEIIVVRIDDIKYTDLAKVCDDVAVVNSATMLDLFHSEEELTCLKNRHPGGPRLWES